MEIYMLYSTSYNDYGEQMIDALAIGNPEQLILLVSIRWPGSVIEYHTDGATIKAYQNDSWDSVATISLLRSIREGLSWAATDMILTSSLKA